MKRNIISLTFALCSWITSYSMEMAQSDSSGYGIHFQTGLKWKDVLIKAKKEHKFIFIDCYATWCVPCKQMEREVYPLREVGNVYNQFICVKYQIDTSKSDSQNTKDARTDAKFIRESYQVKVLPTYLYLTDDGYLLGTASGAMSPEDFIMFAQKTASSDNDYFKLLSDYKQERASLTQIGELAQLSLNAHDTLRSKKFLAVYLKKQPPGEKMTKDNIQLMSAFAKTSGDPGFQFFLSYASSIDKVLQKRIYAEDIVANTLFQEKVVPWLTKSKLEQTQPDWEHFKNQISKNFGKYYGERVVTTARVSWYENQKNWKLWARYFIEFHEKFEDHTATGHWAAFSLNNEAWAIFSYSNDKIALQKALSWSNQAVMMDPNANWMDTYANILYKLGSTEVAIKWEKFVVKNDSSPDFLLNLQKMQSDQPTWSVK